MRLALTLSTGCALLATGCFMEHSMPPDPPITAIEVDAVISGATLGDDCPESGVDGDIDSGACPADAPCPSFCQQSNVQLAITTSEGGGVVTWQVMRVTLHDSETGEELQELAPRDPRVWSESDGYGEWDELLPAPSELSTSYDLQAPDWNDLQSRSSDFWSRSYQIQMLVEVGGVERTLVSSAVYRVSDIDT